MMGDQRQQGVSRAAEVERIGGRLIDFLLRRCDWASHTPADSLHRSQPEDGLDDRGHRLV